MSYKFTCHPLINLNEWHEARPSYTSTTPPKRCGVYAIVSRKHVFNEIQHERAIILYIGSACNLLNRYYSNSLYRKLLKRTDLHAHIDFYFKEVDNYLDVERYLIQEIQPRYNIQHNRRIKKIPAEFTAIRKKVFTDKNSLICADVDYNGNLLVTIKPNIDVSELNANYSRSISIDINDALKFRDELNKFIRKNKKSSSK